MQEAYKTEYKPITLKLTVKTNSKEKIRVRVMDYFRPDRLYSDRWLPVDGEQTFLIKMPRTPKAILYQVYNQNNGNLPANRDHTFKLVDRQVLPLGNSLQIHKFKGEKSKNVKDFILFAQEFSERANDLPASPSGYEYKSNNNKFSIIYFDEIRVDGKPITTPSRVSKSNGNIEVSKKRFRELTIPMRMAILLHEFSHFYVNEKMDDETEADLNALLIYLGLGYPRAEAVQAFTKTFADTEQKKKAANQHSIMNKERIEKIKKFILNFDKRPFLIVYE